MYVILILWLVVLVAAALIVVWLATRYRAPGGPGESPLDIIKRRYAQGEINREEYERMKQELSS